MPDPFSLTAAVATTGLGMVVLKTIIDLLMTKWKPGASTAENYFTRDDQDTLQALGNAHLVNAKDSKGRYKWWGGETTDAVKENTDVLKEVLKEIKKQNGRVRA